MVPEDISNPAQLVAIIAAIVTSLIVLLLSTARYPFIWYFWYIVTIVAIGTSFSLLATTLIIFSTLFFIRYLRLVVNQIAFCSYKPTAVSNRPTFTANHVAVIVPTTEPHGAEFEECIQSLRANRPGSIVIVTAGLGNDRRALDSLDIDANIKIKHCDIPNKRRQICEALEEINIIDTPITVLCDDHVFWPSDFLPHVLAPFEDQKVGCVGTKKRVRRTFFKPFLSLANIWANFWNVLGCLYLERHNFEVAASSTIDGGVFVISGRTSAHRTSILKEQAFTDGFVNEMLSFGPFGSVGPLNADDDNFITRWMVQNGWKTSFQYSEEACIETTLGQFPKFIFQCNRWARTTWRSNYQSLRSMQTWRLQPWCVYAVYLTSFSNFALVWDPALIGTLCIVKDPPLGKKWAIISLCAWIFYSKLVKTWPHFRRYPRDLVYLPAYILFVYVHSAIKFWALLTCWDIQWGSRPLLDKNVGAAALNHDEEQGLLRVLNGYNGGYGTRNNADKVGDTSLNTDVNKGAADIETDEY